jgi:uncharacterized membrane protein affecting hemolysin expression/class 3 adenylate cyclase
MAIKHKIALSFSLLLTLVLAAFWLSLKLQLEQTLSQQTDTLGRILARQTADSVTELVLANDLLGLQVVLTQLAQETGISNVAITDVDGIILASTASPGVIRNEDSNRYVAPITLQDAVAGSVVLFLDEALLSNPVANPDTLFYVIIAAGLALATATAYALSTQFTGPLQELLDTTDPDDPEIGYEPVTLSRSDEIGLLQQRFLDLLWRQRELEAQMEAIALPAEDPEDTSGLKAERRMGTLLAVQVANSSTAIELLNPATLSTLLQQYQFYLRQTARLYRGVVVRINGDSTLVAFDARHCQDEHAFDAFCCAQLFLRLMRRIGQAQRARHAQALEFKLTIHSGNTYYSPIWIKTRPGEEKERQESVIGKPVDLTLALLAHCKAGEILTSEISYGLAEGEARFGAEASREVSLNADKLTMMTYSLSPDAGSHSELLERQCQHLLPEQAAIS